jgi:hypothetical protein
MTFQIIIKDNDKHQKFGKTRSEQEQNMRKEWGRTMTGEQLDKLKFLERKAKEATGKTKGFIPSQDIDGVE